MLAIVVVSRCHSCRRLLMAFLLRQLSHLPLRKLVLRMVTCQRQTQMVSGVHSVFSNNAENNTHNSASKAQGTPNIMEEEGE